ncbi:hypothetical protein ACFYYB_35505 [Streptomyces sp. NPDC002886]|uniref:hypothetical protein n=1 Tax=Streptomyces sp. NPDC002886 TaxID=3364667 RepID=UPI003688F8D0
MPNGTSLCLVADGVELVPVRLSRHAYRSFITTVGSGGAGPAYGLYEFGSQSVCDEHALGEEDFSPCWFTGSLVIAEIGCGSFYRLVVTGQGHGQVWTDDIGCGHSLRPGPDFHDWYVQWLTRSQRITP